MPAARAFALLAARGRSVVCFVLLGTRLLLLLDTGVLLLQLLLATTALGRLLTLLAARACYVKCCLLATLAFCRPL